MLRFALRYLIGISGYIYREMQEDDITVGQLPTILLVGLIGPFTYLGGYVIKHKYKILFPRKK